MRNNLQILFSIYFTIATINTTGGSQNNLDVQVFRQKLANYISSKNQVNHIDRKQLTGGTEVLRKEKNHKMVLAELVRLNSFQAIAEQNSVFVQDSLKYSNAYQKVVDFSNDMVEVQRADIDHGLSQILDETLTKLLTMINQNFIGQRGEQFYYLYDFHSFRSFLHDLKEKKIRFENSCKDQNNQDQVQCTHNLSASYNTLFQYFSTFPLSKVTGPEFKDKYEEEINVDFLDQLNFEQIQEIAQMHIKNIEQGNTKLAQKLRELVQNLVSRKNNILSKFHDSKPSKEKTYENLINFINRKIIIRNNKNIFLNFYVYHFMETLIKVLSTANRAEEQERRLQMVIPYKSFVYEINTVENFLVDAMALRDYLNINKDKDLDNLLQYVENLIGFFNELDNNYSTQYVLEQLKDVKPAVSRSQTQKFQGLQRQSTIRVQNPTFAKKVVSQQLQETQKEKIRNDIMNYQQQVPKSVIVKYFLKFRTEYEISTIHKKRTCERSFYEFLESAGKMFLGSTPLNYQGQEMQIYGYIYRNDFQDKLTKRILELQDCIDQSNEQQDLLGLQQQLEDISKRVQQLYRLNHDFVELKIEYKLDLIKKKLQIKKGKQDVLTEEELQQIKDFQEQMKQQFLQQKNIEEFPEVQYEGTNDLKQQQPKQMQAQQMDIVNETVNEEDENDRPISELNINELTNQRFNQYPMFNDQNIHPFFMNDTNDNQTYDRPEMRINKLKDSKMYTYLEKIDQLDKNDKYINNFKSYQKDIHYIIEAINNLNDSSEKSTFGQGKKGNWISFKFPSQTIEELNKQLDKISQDVTRIYSQESDDMFEIAQKLKKYIRQNIHSTRGNYYEKEFIPNDTNEKNNDVEGLDINELNLQNIEGSRLYPIIKSTISNLNQIYSNHKDSQKDQQQPLNKILESLKKLINDENLQLVQKKSKKYNKKVNYGKYKFRNSNIKNCRESLDAILDNLKDLQTEDIKNLRDDVESFKKFFNFLKGTRAFRYESTEAMFDDNGNFVDFDEKVSQDSSQEGNTSEEEVSNQNQNDIIQEQTNEETSEESQIPLKMMNLEKIQHSKLYKPLQSIQGQKMKDDQARELYNHMASEFNEMVETEELVKTAIRKVKKQKVKFGSYHYQSDKANSFLKYVRQLQILIEEQDENETLKQDLKLVVNLFNTFLSTRKFYYEAFSATLVNDKGQEISKPLYNADFDKLSQTDFSMISDSGLDIQNVARQSLVESSSEEDNSQQHSQESFQNSDDESVSKNQTNIDQIEEKPQKKARRRIYVMDIVTCADCVKDGYVQIVKK